MTATQLVTTCLVLLLLGAARGETLSPELDLYPDLRKDPHADKVLTLWHEITSNTNPLKTHERDAMAKWLRENDETVLPILVEVFRREGNVRERKRAMMWFLASSGDKSEMLNEVRKCLPRLFEDMPYRDPESAFVTSSLTFLSICGGAPDIDLLNELSTSPRKEWAEAAGRELEHLRLRLEEDGRGDVGSHKNSNILSPSEAVGEASPGKGEEVGGRNEESHRWSWWSRCIWLAAAASVAVALARLAIVRRGGKR